MVYLCFPFLIWHWSDLSGPAVTHTAGLSGKEIGQAVCCSVPNLHIRHRCGGSVEVQLRENDALANVKAAGCRKVEIAVRKHFQQAFRESNVGLHVVFDRTENESLTHVWLFWIYFLNSIFKLQLLQLQTLATHKLHPLRTSRGLTEIKPMGLQTALSAQLVQCFNQHSSYWKKNTDLQLRSSLWNKEKWLFLLLDLNVLFY